jgi:2-polyprenyl-3-methyl-5-hydroxy-6-metoxy-1,4-benzoquinol methylase
MAIWQKEFLDTMHITDADTVVDVGCGEGFLCEEVIQTGARVVGVDVDPNFIVEATKRMERAPRGSFKGIHSSCNPIPLPDNFATVVTCTEVLEHVEAPERFLSELVRIGKPRARYLITVPDPASEAIMRVVAPRWYSTDIHPNVFQHERLASLALAAGLEVTHHLRTGFGAAMWWILRMTLGMKDACAPLPPSPSLLTEWEQLLAKLAALPGGQEVLNALSQQVPKSQVLLARKSAQCRERKVDAVTKHSFMAGRGKKILKRLLQFRVGKFEIGVRRVA